jgi:hypothetical protein
MRDSTNAFDIPTMGTQIAAGYSNGTFAWPKASFNRFPDIPHVHIDVNGADPVGSDVLDVETGDATVNVAVAWTLAKHHLTPGAYPPIIYCNRSTLTPLFNAMNAANLKVVKDFRLWVATLDGTKTLGDMTGVTAIQYAGEAQTHGHYDESIVYDRNWFSEIVPPKKKAIRAILIRGLTAKVLTSTDGGVTWR